VTFEQMKEFMADNGFDDVSWNGDETVLDHCVNVADTAGTIARLIAHRGYSIDVEYCQVGGLLHDFAVNVGSRPHEMGRDWGANLLQFHSYELLTRLVGTDEIQMDAHDVIKGALPHPHKFATPATLEEKVIAFADWVNHPGPANVPTSSPVWNHFLENFGPLGATERELARLTGVSNLWDAFAADRHV
jgi:hypothetical protein